MISRKPRNRFLCNYNPVPGRTSGGASGSGGSDSGDVPAEFGGGSGPAGASTDPTEAHLETILESIFAAAVQTGREATGAVPNDEVKERLTDRLPDDVGTSYSELSNILEKLDSTEYVTTERVDGESHISLTPAGEAKVFERDTGSAGSGGGDDHRWVLREAFTAFTKIGYETWLPQQDGGELPDGVADSPIDVTDVDESLSGNEVIEEIQQRKDRLQEQYPPVWELSGADGLSIEAETSTLKTPFQTFNNLNKSKRRGNLCVFALKDESANKGEFAYWGRRAEQAIYETVQHKNSSKIINYEPVWRKRRPDEDSNPRYYNRSCGGDCW
ncbi:hypothetical protein [Halohasta salina]|uniref:hypothetical protein n=1 Tax=Halohasta salina TaxID=2961621 RepID=UPI0020A4690D|nr:hypothetical protein [Halohasta salina]